MERLTEKHYGGKGYYMKCSSVLRCNGTCGDCEELAKAVDRLGEFEDKAEQQPKTNADRIRAMSDEELTTFLNKIVVNHHIKDADNCNHCPLKGARPCDTEGIIDWLKQPAEDGEAMEG